MQDDFKKDKKLTESDVNSIFPMEKIIEESGRWTLLGPRHYHSCTRGFILSGIVRRVDPKKRTLGQFIREEISIPLGIDIYCGMTSTEQATHSIADVTNIDKSYSALHYFGPSSIGMGDPTIKGIIDVFMNKNNPIKRHSEE